MRKKSSFTSTISQEWSIILYNTSGLHQEVMKVRKKGKEIIRPVGVEIREYLNDGWGICNNCGALMDEEIRDRIGVFTCPACGWECDVMDYEYEEEDTMELVQDERGDEYLIPRDDMPPAGCRACGGPYPHCKTSCKMYDD